MGAGCALSSIEAPTVPEANRKDHGISKKNKYTHKQS